MRHLSRLFILLVFVLLVAGISYSADCISSSACVAEGGVPVTTGFYSTSCIFGIRADCKTSCSDWLDTGCSSCYRAMWGSGLGQPAKEYWDFCDRVAGKYCGLWDFIKQDSLCLSSQWTNSLCGGGYCLMPGVYKYNEPAQNVAVVRMKNSAAGDPGICSEVCDPSFSSEAYWTGTHWSCMCTSTRNDELCWQKCKGATGVGVSRLDCYFPHPQAYAGITQQQCVIVDVPCTDAYENYCDGSSYIDYSGKTCKVQGTWNSLTNKCEVSGQLCQCEPKINTDISNPCNTVIKCGGVPNYVNGQQACYEDTAGAMGAWGNYKTKTTLILGKTVGKISLPGQCDRTCGFQYSCDALLNSKDFEASCTEQKEIKGLGCFNTPPVIELCNCVEGGGNCISNYNSDSEAGKEFPDVKLQCKLDPNTGQPTGKREILKSHYPYERVCGSEPTHKCLWSDFTCDKVILKCDKTCGAVCESDMDCPSGEKCDLSDCKCKRGSFHTECNIFQQCITVAGAGTDTCRAALNKPD